MPGFRGTSQCFLIILFALGGCAEFGWNPLDPKEWGDPKMAVPAFSVSWPTVPLHGRDTIARRYWREDGGYVAEFRWTRKQAVQAHAALRLEGQVPAATRKAVLAEPVSVAQGWPELAIRSMSETGPIYVQPDPKGGGDWLWQRALVGPELCVLFARVPAAEPTGLQSGWFCHAPGEALSEAQGAGLLADLAIQTPG